MKKYLMLLVILGLSCVSVQGAEEPVLTPPNWSYSQFTESPEAYYAAWNTFLTQVATAAGKQQAEVRLDTDGWSLKTSVGNVLFGWMLMPFAKTPETINAQDYVGRFYPSVRVNWPLNMNSRPVLNIREFDRPEFIGSEFELTQFRSAYISNIAGTNGDGILTLGMSQIGVFHGIDVGLECNDSYKLNGVQIAAWKNHTSVLNGFQIGVFNSVSYTLGSNGLGLQIGLFNYNGRLTLPILNIVY